jgi:hypothetical protein
MGMHRRCDFDQFGNFETAYGQVGAAELAGGRLAGSLLRRVAVALAFGAVLGVAPPASAQFFTREAPPKTEAYFGACRPGKVSHAAI